MRLGRVQFECGDEGRCGTLIRNGLVRRNIRSGHYGIFEEARTTVVFARAIEFVGKV